MKNLFDLTGKVALVNGASSGLGASAAVAYAEYGADVIICARRIEKLEEVKKQIEALGRKCLAVKCDATVEDEIKNAVQKGIKAFGHIDILLNNAGIAVRGGVDSLNVEDWDKSFNTNVRSDFLFSKYVIPHMIEQKYGKVVNVASVNAVVGDKDDRFIRHAYNASKSAVLGLTIGMADSYGKYGITVNAIGPGLFETEMTQNTLFKSPQFLGYYGQINPMGRPGAKGELNGTIIYLSSDASSYVTGEFILVDGGATLV